MIHYRCNLPRLVIRDVSPPLVFQYGKISGIDDLVLSRSPELRRAVERNELTPVKLDTPPKPAPVTHTRDTTSMIQMIASLKEAITSLVMPAPQVDMVDTNNLLAELLQEIKGLRRDISSLPTRTVHSVTTSEPSMVSDEVYIPSSFRNTEMKGNMKVTDSKESGVSDAEDALRAMMKGRT